MENELLLAIAFFIVVLLGALGYVIIVKKASIFEPALQFLFFFSLFTLPLPIRALVTNVIEGDVTEHLPLLRPYLSPAVFMSALGIIFFVVGYYSSLAKLIVCHLPFPGRGKKALSLLATILLGGISLLLIYCLGRGAGGILKLILLGYNSSAELFNSGYLAIGFPWLLIASMFFLYRYALFHSKKDLVFFTLFFLIIIAINLIMGNRGFIVYMTMVVLLFIHFTIKRLSLRNILVLFLIGFFALNLFGYLRSSNYTSLSDFLSRTSTSFANIQQSGVTRSGLIYTLTTGEFVVPFETFPQIISSFGLEAEPRFGATYIIAPLFYIPRAFYPQRPEDLTYWYMNTFYEAELGRNVGRAFFFLAEGYLNFGPAGVFLTMFLWGCFLGALRYYVLRANGEPGAVLLYALSCAFIYRGISGNFISIFVGLPEQSLIPAMAGLLIATGFTGWHFKSRAKKSYKVNI